jgi:hypothetical protein
MKNWKTTTLGIVGIVITLAQAVQELLTNGTVTNVEPLVTSLVLGWGLIAAKDNTARL